MNHPVQKESHRGGRSSCLRFFATIATLMVTMFVLMYPHSYAIVDYAWFSKTRLIMASAMIVVMLGMYTSKRVNIGTYAAAGLRPWTATTQRVLQTSFALRAS